MSVFKHFWQNLVQRFRPRAPWSPAEFEHELSAARQERQTLLGQLTGLQAEVERDLSAAKQEQQSLLGQLHALHTRVEQELTEAGREMQALRAELTGLQSEVEHGLSAVREEQQGLLGQVTGLQSEIEHGLASVRQEQQDLHGQLTGLQAELERIRNRDEQLRAELQQRFDRLQAERDAANQEIAALRALLDDARSVQQTTDSRVNALELRLKEQQQEHDVDLQQTLVRERRQARRLTAVMTVAAAAFVLGIVGSAINYWEVRSTTRLLNEVSQGIRAIRITMESHSAAPAPSTLSPAATEEPVSADSPQSAPGAGDGAAQESGDGLQGSVKQKLPEPDFIASKTLPLDGHSFGSRQDEHAFFEENARQPGVLVLPGGLQYRVLIAGAGKSPGTGDQVVVEYRSFRPDGTETDNSFREDLPMTLSVDKAIPGLREALPHMREGAQWELYIPSSLSTPGIRKRGPHGFEPLIMTVELVSVVSAESASEP